MSDDDPREPSDDDAGKPESPALETAASPSRIKREGRAKREKRECEEFWAAALSNPVGRRALWQVLSLGHPFETRFANGPSGFPDGNATWYHKGEQDLGQRIYDYWTLISPDGAIHMRIEHDFRFADRRKAKGD